MTVGSPRHSSAVIETTTKTATPWDTVSPLIVEEVKLIQDEIGMAILKQRFQCILPNEDERGLNEESTMSTSDRIDRAFEILNSVYDKAQLRK